jgi:uncharacterized DUF497 family protein
VIIRFEWDLDKARANVRKHGVPFQEAATVFGDGLASTFVDPVHSIGEERLVSFGMSHRRRLLAVMHVEREEADADGKPVRIIRLISARRATRPERQAYEEAR